METDASGGRPCSVVTRVSQNDDVVEMAETAGSPASRIKLVLQVDVVVSRSVCFMSVG